MMIHCISWMASMRAEYFCTSAAAESGARVWCRWGAFGPPGGLGCCPFWGGGSVVVDFLFVVAPIVGVCDCSMFCCALLYVHFGIAGVLMGRGGGAGCFAWFVFLVSRGGWGALPRGAAGLSAVCDCGIS